jgi:hypothetical protein
MDSLQHRIVRDMTSYERRKNETRGLDIHANGEIISHLRVACVVRRSVGVYV